jgi:NAD(P)H-hydrate epimerase
LATAEGAVPSLTLMENAGLGASELILREFPKAAHVVIVCGTGNNGGDGFVVARRLLAKGLEVTTLLVGEPARVRGDARTTLDALSAAPGTYTQLTEDALTPLDDALANADLIVDALFGTGLDREVAGLARTVIERMNAAPGVRVALDLPSGLDADTGVALGVAVRAELTLTFAQLKRGLATPLGVAHAGRVELVPIGVPEGLIDRVGYGAIRLEPADIARSLSPRNALSHKGSSGRVLVIAGSPGKVGAALLVARGALRAGAGLVTIAAESAVSDVLDQRVLEEMTARIDLQSLEASLAPWLERSDVVVIGPGLGLEAGAKRLVEYVLLESGGSIVVDADAITLFRGRAQELARAKGKLLLTPHPAEMGRLLDSSTAAVESDRFGAVERAVELTQATVLLKGSRTLIGAPGRQVAVNPTGNPLLAAGGMGDVLAGIIGALAVGSDTFSAACAGAYVHGLAADQIADSRGLDRGVLAHEIADEVPAALATLL